MPQVPYSPVPQPGQMIATPKVSVNTPDAAFGGVVGQALEGAGKQLEHSGDEIFKRAIAIQDLRNETDAKEADANYMMKVGELHANFSSLQGRQAADAYPKYVQDMQELRQNMRDDLPNDSARKMFDSSSLSTMGRTIFNGAGHAATQMKVAANNASVARVDMFKQDALNNPTDDVGFQRSLNGIKGEIDSQADIGGWDEAQKADQKNKAISSAWAHRIVGLSRTEPYKAQELLDANRDYLHPNDIDRVERTVETQVRNTGSRNISHEVNSDLYEPGDPTKPEKPLQERITEAREKAEKLRPDDPVFLDMVTERTRGEYNRHKAEIKDFENRNLDTIDKGIIGDFSEGKMPKNIDELRAVNPSVATAIDSLSSHRQAELQGKINRINSAANHQNNLEETRVRRDQADIRREQAEGRREQREVKSQQKEDLKVTQQNENLRLLGMADNDVGEFLDLDVTKANVSYGDMKTLIKLQQQKRANVEADPRVNRAIGQFRAAKGSDLEALGIFRRTADNKDDYDKFSGAMQQALETWADVYKKPPTEKDIVDTIGPQIIRQQVQSKWFGWGTEKGDPAFKQPVPEDMAKKIKAAPEWMELPETEQTEDRLKQVYNRLVFKNLFEAGIKKSQDKVGK